MKNRLLSILCLFLLCAPMAQAQETANDVYNKILKIDMLFNVLPLLLTKKQLNDILPVVEKCRARIKKAGKDADKVYSEVSGLAGDTYKKSVDSGDMPPDAARSKLAAAVRAANVLRAQTIGENIAEAYAAFDKVLNPEQKKVAANTIDITFYDPSAKPKEMSQEDKDRAYVRYVLLDPAAYEVMLDLLRAAKD